MPVDDAIKLYISDQIKETRHKLANDFQTALIWLDTKLDTIKDRQASYEATQKLQNQVNDSLKDDLKLANLGINKMLDKIEHLDKKFVTKEELKRVDKTIWVIQKGLLWAIYLVLGWVIGALLKVIFIS